VESLSDNGQSDAYLWGRLYAAALALEAIRTGNGDWLGDQSKILKAVKSPRSTLAPHLRELANRLLEAKQKSAARGKAAAEVFKAIPELVPAKGQLPNTLGDTEAAQFLDGFHAQKRSYEEEYGALVK
jgi:hypothetical protein